MSTESDQAQDAVSDPWRRWTGVHGRSLRRLVDEATRLGLAAVPLHPLGVLTDPIDESWLALPGGLHLLRGAALVRYLVAREFAEVQAFRHLVESNLSCFKDVLTDYRTGSWRVEMRVEDRSSDSRLDAHVQWITRHGQERDEVVLVDSFGVDDSLWVDSKGVPFTTIRRVAYDRVERDMQSVLSGTDALGTAEL